MSEQKYTPEPWSYKPQKHDDWGFIRSANGSLVAIAKDSDISYDQMDVFRSDKKDPYEPNGKRIVECVNALAGIENPAEWVKLMKVYKKQHENEVFLNNNFREQLTEASKQVAQLQSENERLKANVLHYEINVCADLDREIELLKAELKSVSENERNMLERLVQQLKDYTRESHNILGFDDREPKEFVDIFYDSLFNKN